MSTRRNSNNRPSVVDVQTKTEQPAAVNEATQQVSTKRGVIISDLSKATYHQPPFSHSSTTNKKGTFLGLVLTLPLSAVLALQCLLVVFAFVALVLMTSLMMDNATRKLVRQSVSSDLQYARARILAPIQSYEHTALTLRQSYLYLSKALGKEICADSPSFMDSRQFFIMGTIAVQQNSRISYVYHLRRSDTRLHPVEGLPDVVECDVTPESIALINNASRLTDFAVGIDEMGDLDSIPYSLDPTDYYYESYVTDALSYTRVGWQPYLYIDPVTQESDLFLAGYFPLKVKRTFVNGTEEVYEPNLYTLEADVEDVAESVSESTIGLDVGMTQFKDLMKGITPDTDGAHTSVYDLAHEVLVATSESVQLYDENFLMWPAGATSSTKLNKAFEQYKSLGFGVTALEETFSSTEDAAEESAGVHVQYHDSNVVSTISVRTSSGINFAIVQSTPEEHYLGPVTRLRNIMIVVGVVAAVAVVGVCLVIGFAIRSPLKDIDVNMQLAAVMKNDRVEATTSILTEINELCGAFDRMNAKLLQARDFMPQSMLLDSTEDDDEDEADIKTVEMTPQRNSLYQSEDEDNISHKPSQTTTNHSPLASVADTGSKRDFGRTQSRKVARESQWGPTSTTIVSNLIVHKRVTILAINARGFHSAVNVTMPASIATPAAELTALVNGVCTACRGVIDSFHGDHFVLSFNAARNNAQGPQCSTRAALSIISAVHGTRSFYMGASTGRACVGHLGTTGLKRLSIVGRAYSRALALEGVCRRANEATASDDTTTPVQCMIDRALAVEVCDTHALQVLGMVRGGPFGSKTGDEISKEVDVQAPSTDTNVLYALRGSESQNAECKQSAVVAKTSDEWLYEVQQFASQDQMLVAVNGAMIDAVFALQGSAEKLEEEKVILVREALNLALNRIAEMPCPAADSSTLSFSWGREALENARKIANGKALVHIA